MAAVDKSGVRPRAVILLVVFVLHIVALGEFTRLRQMHKVAVSADTPKKIEVVWFSPISRSREADQPPIAAHAVVPASGAARVPIHSRRSPKQDPSAELQHVLTPQAPLRDSKRITPPLQLELDLHEMRSIALRKNFAERADELMPELRPLSAQQRLARDIERAGFGNCLQGEYEGGGMGLLSVPFFIVAELRGRCRE